MDLSLVAFASSGPRDALLSILHTIGYKVFPLEQTDWLRNVEGTCKHPTVIFIGSALFPRNEILDRIKNFCFRILGVFQSETALGDREILSSCGEFVRWPCHDAELAERLERMGVGPSSRIVTDEEADLGARFADLCLIGRSEEFTEALQVIGKFALCEAPVLIEGETGTGKELAARAIHYLGTRQDYPFIPVNCGALPDNIVENELFGHERGAYTDAKERQPGLIELAGEGTLFLDEINSLSPKAQVVLLRFLQDKEYRPLGSKVSKISKARVVAASSTDLQRAVEGKSFRKDLFFRLNVMQLTLPPLRRRGRDIDLLTDHFLKQFSDKYDSPLKRLCERSRAWMRGYEWPGNVRELEALLHKSFLLADGNTIRLAKAGQDRPEHERGRFEDRTGFSVDAKFSLAKSAAIAEFEVRYLSTLISECRGNVSAAARLAGKERRAFGRLLKKYGIDKNRFLDPSPSSAFRC